MEGSQMVALRLFLTSALTVLQTNKTAVTSRTTLDHIISVENTQAQV